jgi:hypothetical protein
VEETKELSLLHAIVGELDKTTLTNKKHIEHWQFLSRQETRKSMTGNKPWKQEEAHHQKVCWFALPWMLSNTLWFHN